MSPYWVDTAAGRRQCCARRDRRLTEDQLQHREHAMEEVVAMHGGRDGGLVGFVVTDAESVADVRQRASFGFQQRAKGGLATRRIQQLLRRELLVLCLQRLGSFPRVPKLLQRDLVREWTSILNAR